MSVLEAPQTWIAAAAVLVVAAVVLIALAPRRRGEATGATTGATDTDSGPSPEATPATASGAAVDPVAVRPPPDDPDEATTGPVAPPVVARVDQGDDAVTDENPSWAAGPAPGGEHADDAEDAPATTPVDPVTRAASPSAPVADPARAGERAKDRLLAVLLADPAAAVDVVAAMPDGASGSGGSAAALLRAGLSPAQVAGLCGTDERDLADLVARDLGLFEALNARGAAGTAQTGSSRTDEPGRAWASAGSAVSSTTPTTG